MRAALFVDAGYLFSAGSEFLLGFRYRRHQLALVDPARLIATLTTATEACCAEPVRVLRTYWYDGAVDGIPTSEQIAIGELPQVKLRLGRVSGGGQKGVDGLIILDVLNLARNRAIDVAVLFSGDEDLREAALYAQGFGVSLVVAGFPKTATQGQSALLLREADHVVQLTAAQTRDHIVLASALDAGEATEPEVGEAAPADPDTALREVCAGIVDDPRFTTSGVLDRTGRVARGADKVLVARLAEVTGTFPVSAEVLTRARRILRDLAHERASPPD